MTVVLPGTGGEFQGDAQEFRIGLGFGTFEVGQELAGAGCLGRHLGQPDRRLDRLDLAKERADALEWITSPVFERARCLRRDLPLIGA